MKLTPDGPVVAPSPGWAASLVLRRVAVANDYDGTPLFLRVFRDWVSEQTGYPTDCIHLTVSHNSVGAWVLVGGTYIARDPEEPYTTEDGLWVDPSQHARTYRPVR